MEKVTRVFNIRVLSEIARRLSDDTVYERIFEANDEDVIYNILVNPAVHPGAEAKKERLSAAMCSHALKLVEEVKAKAIIITKDETRFPKSDFLH